jgi:type II secretory pathway pseudopilin PulG
MKHRFRGQTLIGLLVVVAIIMVLFVMYFGRRTGPDGTEEKSIVAASMDKARETELANNLAQIQMIIGMYRGDNEGRVPASLEELKRYAKFPEEMWINPVNKQPLVYDPTTGTVSAPGMKKPNAAGVISAQDSAPIPTPLAPIAPQIPTPQSDVPTSATLD